MDYHEYDELISNNKRWAKSLLDQDPDYFRRQALSQNPPYLFIGCSDSRKPLNMITQTKMGEVFIHRNVANQVSLTDMNFLTVLEYAVVTLKVKHIIVCGHYGCGGVVAAYHGTATGLVENWLMPIRDLYLQNKDMLHAIETESDRIDKLCEMNVISQAKNVCRTSVMRNAFKEGHYPHLHAWIFEMDSGLIKELPLPVADWQQLGLLPDQFKTSN